MNESFERYPSVPTTTEYLTGTKQYGDYFPSTERDELQRQLAEAKKEIADADAETDKALTQLAAEREAREKAEAKLALAVDALVRYGEHDLNCPVYRDTIGDCDCGWTDTLPKLTAAGKGREP